MSLLARAMIAIGGAALDVADAVLSTDVPPTPDNFGRNCHRCSHEWHGLSCPKCGCSSAFVEPA